MPWDRAEPKAPRAAAAAVTPTAIGSVESGTVPASEDELFPDAEVSRGVDLTVSDVTAAPAFVAVTEGVFLSVTDSFFFAVEREICVDAGFRETG